jgi:hypothetical protein
MYIINLIHFSRILLFSLHNNNDDILTPKIITNVTCADTTWLGTRGPDEEKTKTHSFDWSLSNKQGEEHSQTITDSEYQLIFLSDKITFRN